MAQSKVTKTGSKAQEGVLARITNAIQRFGDHRLALGAMFREALASGLTRKEIINRVTDSLPNDPRYYLGAKLDNTLINALIAEADAVEKNPDGFIHGTNVVTKDDIDALGLPPVQRAALVTALHNGIQGRPGGVSVASVMNAARSVRKNGRTSDAGQATLEKLVKSITFADKYRDTEPGSLDDKLRILTVRREKVVSLEASLVRAKQAVRDAEAEVEAARARASIAQAQTNAEADEAKAAPPAEAPKKGNGKGGNRQPRARQPKVERIEAAASN